MGEIGACIGEYARQDARIGSDDNKSQGLCTWAVHQDAINSIMLGNLMFAKKNIVAAAALTLVAVAAHAQVTVYGNLDVSVGR
ncbi:hypothetical protein, partial [Aquabacterium sp.]|uniref:hypothetical protein n=1 Tax=Aquabacterium sp. TaxID=1872578 RepID=UPI0019A9F54A